MSIGGFDIGFLAPSGECVGDMILRACSRLWAGKHCFFQDVDAETAMSFEDRRVWDRGTASKEFFVFRDADAVSSWAKLGAAPANRNTMLHFIVGHVDPLAPGSVSVTMVCDRPTKEIRSLVADLKRNFAALVPRKAA